MSARPPDSEAVAGALRGAHDAPWLGCLETWLRVGLRAPLRQRGLVWAAMATGWWWPCTEEVIVSERPCAVRRDALGAPLRLVVPWKYGYKSIKSIERIELVGREPATFWTTLNPRAYPFESNVDPTVHRPWNQAEERMLGTGEVRPTEKYNGYGRWVAGLYEPRA